MIYNLFIATLFPVCMAGACAGNNSPRTESVEKQESGASVTLTTEVQSAQLVSKNVDEVLRQDTLHPG